MYEQHIIFISLLLSCLIVTHYKLLKEGSNKKIPHRGLAERKGRLSFTYYLLLSKPLYKLTITDRQADRQKKPLIGAKQPSRSSQNVIKPN